MKNNVAIFSDIHLGIHQNSPFWIEISLQWARWFVSEIDKQNITDVIFCGDFFHYRDEVSLLSLDAARKLLDIFKNKTIYMITGNHDCYYKETSEINSLSIFSGRDNIKVIESVTTLNFNGKNVTFCPWGTKIDLIPKSDIIFGHFELQNFRMNGFKICDSGDLPEVLLSKAPLVFSGHFHLRDERSFGNNKIIYVGNPFEMDFGDSYQQKGYYILDLNKSSYTFTENALTPKHIKIFLSKLITVPNIDKLFNTIISNNIIRLIIDKNISTEHLDALMAFISGYKPIDISIDYDVNYNKLKVDNDTNVDLSGVVIEQAIEEFINLLDISNKKEVIEYTNNLYSRSKLV